MFLPNAFPFLIKSNQGRYKFLDLNSDLSLDTLYFYRKITEWVIKPFDCDRIFQK